MIFEKSKTYNYLESLGEINASMTAKAVFENDDMFVIMQPIIGKVGEQSSMNVGNDIYKKVKSFVTHNADGYVFFASKNFVTNACTLSGVAVSVDNKKAEPLVINVNESVLGIGSYVGQPFYKGKYIDQGMSKQPNIIIPPKSKLMFILNRADATFQSSYFGSNWYLPVEKIDFKNISANISLKIGEGYVTLNALGEIPDNIIDKYDILKQFPGVYKK